MCRCYDANGGTTRTAWRYSPRNVEIQKSSERQETNSLRHNVPIRLPPSSPIRLRPVKFLARHPSPTPRGATRFASRDSVSDRPPTLALALLSDRLSVRAPACVGCPPPKIRVRVYHTAARRGRQVERLVSTRMSGVGEGHGWRGFGWLKTYDEYGTARASINIETIFTASHQPTLFRINRYVFHPTIIVCDLTKLRNETTRFHSTPPRRADSTGETILPIRT